MKESELQRKIIAKLKYNSDVVWVYRTMAGRVGGYVLGVAGHPDITCVIRRRDGHLGLLFLEVKVGNGKLRYEQRKFFEEYEFEGRVLCRVINDFKQIDKFIKECQQL